MKNRKENIEETIILRIIEDKADNDDIRIFDEWINSSPQNKELFDQLKNTYHLLSIGQESINKNWKAIVHKVKNGHNIPGYIQLPQKQKIPIPKTIKLLVRIAAVFLILLGISLLLKNIVFEPEQLIISSNDLNENDPYKLPDGSLVYLNDSSEISIPKKFGLKTRNVTLKGEAFFDVKRNTKTPFMVTCNETTVKVLGTRFNVNSTSNEVINVSVLSGVVEFYVGNRESLVQLKVNERGIFNPQSHKIDKLQYQDKNFLSWHTGVLYFHETPISDAFKMLGKQYMHVFVLDGKQDVEPCITTTFENQSLRAVLEELNLLLNTKNVIYNDTILFKQNN